jgi:hypothetical protein
VGVCKGRRSAAAAAAAAGKLALKSIDSRQAGEHSKHKQRE